MFRLQRQEVTVLTAPLMRMVGMFSIIVVDSALGAMAMLYVNRRLLTYEDQDMLAPEILLGAVVGAAIGLIAWYSRLKPIRFASIVSVLVAMYLSSSLYKFYYEAFHSQSKYVGWGYLVERLVSTVVGVFVVGLVGALMANCLQQRLGSPHRSAISEGRDD